MDDCCAKGHIHSGNPTGTMVQVAGAQTYLAQAKNFTGRAVLFLTDAFGLEFINNKLLADTYAAQANVNVYMPHIFNGEPFPVSALEGVPFDRDTWIGNNPKSFSIDIANNVAKELREKHGVTKLAAIGFCWGAFSTLTLGAGDLVDAVAVAHPSRLDLPSDVENLKKPCLFLCAETDQQFDQDKQALSKEVLKNRMDEGHQFVFYPGTHHGFAVRFDSKDEVSAKAAEDAKDQAVAFFNKHL